MAEGAARRSAEVATHIEVVLVNLPTPEVGREVALGPDDLTDGSAIRDHLDAAEQRSSLNLPGDHNQRAITYDPLLLECNSRRRAIK